MQEIEKDIVIRNTIKTYYSNKLRKLPDVLSARDVRNITGYSKEAVRKWIVGEKLVAVISRNKFIVAKEDLLEFLMSNYYLKITRKLKEHIADFEQLGLYEFLPKEDV